jgi:hypothetical protein
MNPLSSSAAISPGLATPLVPLTRGAKAAREFEAQLLGPLLESLEKTFAAVPGGNTPGADDYNYLGTQALASALAASGKFGIGTMINHYFSTHEGDR